MLPQAARAKDMPETPTKIGKSTTSTASGRQAPKLGASKKLATLSTKTTPKLPQKPGYQGSKEADARKEFSSPDIGVKDAIGLEDESLSKLDDAADTESLPEADPEPVPDSDEDELSETGKAGEAGDTGSMDAAEESGSAAPPKDLKSSAHGVGNLAAKGSYEASQEDVGDRAQDTVEDAGEDAADTADEPLPDLSVLRGLKVQADGDIIDGSGDLIGRLTEGDPDDLEGYEVGDEGEILDEDGDVIGRAEHVARTVPVSSAAGAEPEGTVEANQSVQPLSGLKVNIIQVNAIVNEDGLIVGKLTEGDPKQLEGKIIGEQGEIVDDDGNVIGYADAFSKPFAPEDLGIEHPQPPSEVEEGLPGLERLEGLNGLDHSKILGAIPLNSRGAVVDEHGEIIAELFQGDLGECAGKVPDENGHVFDAEGHVIGTVTILSRSEGTWQELEAEKNAWQGNSSCAKLFADATHKLQDLLATHAFGGVLNEIAIGLDDNLMKMRHWASDIGFDEIMLDSMEAQSPYLAMADQMMLRDVVTNVRKLDLILAESNPLPSGVVSRVARRIDRAVSALTDDIRPYQNAFDLHEKRGPATAMRDQMRQYERRIQGVDIDPEEEKRRPSTDLSMTRLSTDELPVPPEQDAGDTSPPEQPTNKPSPLVDADGNELNVQDFARKLQLNNSIMMKFLAGQ